MRRANVMAAHQRVVRNGGAPGVDGLTVDELLDYCREHWPRHREELLSGRYQAQPVRRVMIPKPGGGERMLGIPTVLDRLIQQALLQVLQPIFDPTFSEGSFGYRPGRSAHQAVLTARAHVRSGHRWVVDLDLEKFFDRINHDVLVARVARRVKDKRVLRLIRRYLQAGMMAGGVVSPRSEGTPQGGCCRRCSRTSCSMSWIGSWSYAVGARELPRRVPSTCALCLNRRIRNRTCGGVGAAAGDRPGYPILSGAVPRRRGLDSSGLVPM